MDFLNYLNHMTQLFSKLFFTQLTRICIWHKIDLIQNQQGGSLCLNLEIDEK